MNKSSSLKSIFIFILICAFLALYLGSTANIKKLNTQVSDLKAQVELQAKDYELLKSTTVSKTEYDKLVKVNSDLQKEFDNYKETSVSKEEYDAKVEELENAKITVNDREEYIHQLNCSLAECCYQLNGNKVVFEYVYGNHSSAYEDFKNEIGSCVTSIYVTYGEKTVASHEDNFTSALKEEGAVLHLEFTNKLDKKVDFGVQFNRQSVCFFGNNVIIDLSYKDNAFILGNDELNIFSISIRYIEQ